MRKGFSLIEIMIVIIILGLLASLVLPNLMGQAGKAKKDIVCMQMKTLASSLKTFKFTLGTYPTTEQGIEALAVNPDADAYVSYPDGGFLDEGQIPKDSWKHPFIYLNENGSFELISLGADGKEGGEGESADITYTSCKQK